MLAGDFLVQPVLTTSSGPIKQVDDFRYLGCWLKDSMKFFLTWWAQAFDAANQMWYIWKSDFSKSLKIRLFCATIESVLLHGSETWCTYDPVDGKEAQQSVHSSAMESSQYKLENESPQCPIVQSDAKAIHTGHNVEVATC